MTADRYCLVGPLGKGQKELSVRFGEWVYSSGRAVGDLYLISNLVGVTYCYFILNLNQENVFV